MNLWSWSSPMAWAVFLVAVSATAIGLAWSLRVLAVATRDFMSQSNGRRR